MSQPRLFTSESVSPGHPDKIADQISDAILDACLRLDPMARVACEALVKDNLIVIAGELGSETRNLLDEIDPESIARGVVRDIGYNDDELGFSADTCEVTVVLGGQSKNIARGIGATSDQIRNGDLGAGDQGLMFGYANNDTEVLMPAPIHYAHRLMEKHRDLLRADELPWLRPDAKSQVTFEYDDFGKPKRIDTVVLSTQHDPEVDGHTDEVKVLKAVREAVTDKIIKPVLGDKYDERIKIVVNSAGIFELGGPAEDCGLTGRKIIVDTYGGMARHGGGAFSGKDPSKVDRSAAYAARFIAKNIVAMEMASECELQISYAIGVPEPVAIWVRTGTEQGASHDDILKYVKTNFDLTPAGIIKMLDLRRPIYQKTAALGHFGREDADFSWERVNLQDA